jgi:3-oxoacyl-[acyl-carrier protein] reductase
MRKLEKKVAIVTGAGRGIGRAIALKLAEEGARVVVNDLDGETVDIVVAEIDAAGGEAAGCAGSVIEDGFAERLIETAISRWGDWHIIVNNAGYTWDNVIQKMSDEQFDAIVDVHLKAPFRILRAAAEPLRTLARAETAEGRRVVRKVVNISSIAGTTGNPGQSNYASAKAGVTGLTKTLAKEWGRYGVTVNCVAFGLIHTRLTQPLGSSEGTVSVDGRDVAIGVAETTLAAARAAIPLERGGTPEEAAGSVYMFCIPESDYVTGQVIVCGGGFGSIT